MAKAREVECDVRAKAIDELLWLAIVAAEDAGWLDIRDRVLAIKNDTAARRRALHTAA